MTSRSVVCLFVGILTCDNCMWKVIAKSPFLSYLFDFIISTRSFILKSVGCPKGAKCSKWLFHVLDKN
jgi:hypothetical protein